MISQSLVKYAYELAADISADAVLVYANAAAAIDDIRETLKNSPLRTIVATRAQAEPAFLADIPQALWISVSDFPMTRLGQVRIALLVSLARGVLKKGDRVVVLTGVDRSLQIDTVMVVNLETESELISVSNSILLESEIHSGVFERALSLAAQIAYEGREGHQVGTIFVIGDSEEVLRHSKNLVLNPFYGYAPENRSLMDSRLTETIKEFSSIDGAFVISSTGTIETAGARLLATEVADSLPVGLGTRHAAAAAITYITKAVSIAVSQSTGNISVFRSGHLISEISRHSPRI